MGHVTYRIERPASMKKAHNVIHVSKGKKYNRSDDKSSVSIMIDAKDPPRMFSMP